MNCPYTIPSPSGYVPLFPGTTSVPLRRDLFVRSVIQRSIIHCLSAGTEVPRRKRG